LPGQVGAAPQVAAPGSGQTTTTGDVVVILPLCANAPADEGVWKEMPIADVIKWAGGDVPSAVESLKEALEWIRSGGFFIKAYIKKVKGKPILVLKGDPVVRKMFTATKYKPTNPIVLHLTLKGALKTGGAVTKGSVLTIVATVAADIAEGVIQDLSGERILANVEVDVAVACASLYAGVVAGAAVSGWLAGAAAGAAAGSVFPVVGTLVGFIVGAAVGIGLSYAVEETGLKKAVGDGMEAYTKWLAE
jgi:hypothetical protein